MCDRSFIASLQCMSYPARTGVVELIDDIVVSDVYGLGRCVENCDDGLIVDVGAHAGVFTMWAMYNGFTVNSYEPHPVNFECLTENLQKAVAMSLRGKVHPHRIAVDGVRGECSVFEAAPSECHTTFMPAAEFYQSRLKEVCKVSTVTLEDIVNTCKSTIALLKIDCEGCEYRILSSTPPGVFHSIHRISLEFHEDIAGCSTRQMCELLSSHGYDSYVSNDQRYRNRFLIRCSRK